MTLAAVRRDRSSYTKRVQNRLDSATENFAPTRSPLPAQTSVALSSILRAIKRGARAPNLSPLSRRPM